MKYFLTVSRLILFWWPGLRLCCDILYVTLTSGGHRKNRFVEMRDLYSTVDKLISKRKNSK
jgi:hypothetical protein